MEQYHNKHFYFQKTSKCFNYVKKIKHLIIILYYFANPILKYILLGIDSFFFHIILYLNIPKLSKVN